VRLRIRFSHWLPATCLLIMPACSGEERFALPPVPIGAPSTRYQDACTALAQSDCNWKALCGLPFPWVSGEQCVARETLSCELLAADPGVSFDEEAIRECQFPQDCSTPPPICWPQGRTPLGQPCLWNEACQSERCVGVGSVRLGICGLCAPGEGCQPDSAGGTCVPLPRGPGESCTSSTDCQSGQCVTSCLNGKCMADPQANGFNLPGMATPDASSDATKMGMGPPMAVGTPFPQTPLHCAPFGQLNDRCGQNDTPECDPDLACDANGHCSAIVQAGYGAQCGISDGVTGVDGGVLVPHCEGFAKCGMTTGMCEAPADDGQPCDPGHDCVPPAACVANHCIFPTLADCSL
jgi:hypothetical protein